MVVPKKTQFHSDWQFHRKFSGSAVWNEVPLFLFVFVHALKYEYVLSVCLQNVLSFYELLLPPQFLSTRALYSGTTGNAVVVLWNFIKHNIEHFTNRNFDIGCLVN